MNSKLLILLSLVICVALGVAIYNFLEEGDAELLRNEGGTASSQEDDGSRSRVRRADVVDRVAGGDEENGDVEPEAGVEPGRSGVPICQVSGRAVDTRGRPIADARVSLSKRSGLVRMFFAASRAAKEEAVVLSDASGRFAFSQVEYWSQWTLRLEHGSYQSKQIPVDVAARDVRTGDIAMEPGGALQGRVIDEETGDPVEGARVVASIHKSQGNHMIMVGSFNGPASSSPSAMTDVNGDFEISGLGSGNGRVYVDRDGYCPAKSSFLSVKQVSGMRLLEIEKGKEIVVGLVRGGTLIGTVTDEVGQAIARAQVVVREPSHDGRMTLSSDEGPPFGMNRDQVVGETDDEGRFAITGLPRQKYSVQITARRFAMETLESVSESDNLAVKMKRSGVLWGVVTDNASGQPIEDVVIVFRRPGSGSRVFSFGPPEAKKNLDVDVLRGEAAADLVGVVATVGLFAISGLPESKVVCDIRADGFLVQTLKDLSVSSSEVVEIHPELVRAATITGVVLDHLGQPVAGASVPPDRSSRSRINDRFFAMRSSPFRPKLPSFVRADGEGRFKLEGLKAGKISLSASHPAHLDSETRSFELQVGEELKDQVFQLGAAGSLVGRVFDQNGEPLPQGVVKLRNVNDEPEDERVIFGPGLGATRLNCTADQKGEFRLDGVTPGVYRAVLSAPLGGGISGPGIMVFGGQNAKKSQPQELTIVASEETRANLSLQSSCSIEGQVTGAGLGVAGVKVRLKGKAATPFGDFGPGKSARTDAEGYYRIEGFEPGEYDLVVTAKEAGLPTTTRVVFGGGQALVRDIQLPLGVISGTILAQESGKPLTGVRVTLSSDNGEDTSSDEGTVSTFIIGGSTSGESASISTSFTGPSQSKTQRTDAKGHYEFRFVGSGVYRVSISGGDIIKVAKRGIEMDDGDRVSNVNLLAARGSSLTIDAPKSEGEPKHFLLTLRGIDPLTYKSGTRFVESGKSTTIDGLAPGHYTLEVRDPSQYVKGSVEPRRVQVTSGSHQTITLGN